jgi:hypothetical protein
MRLRMYYVRKTVVRSKRSTHVHTHTYIYIYTHTHTDTYRVQKIATKKHVKVCVAMDRVQKVSSKMICVIQSTWASVSFH